MEVFSYQRPKKEKRSDMPGLGRLVLNNLEVPLLIKIFLHCPLKFSVKT